MTEAIKESVTFRYTNAPKDYDYPYVETVAHIGNGWRKIKVTDIYLFENYQKPRYASGMYWVEQSAANVPAK